MNENFLILIEQLTNTYQNEILKFEQLDFLAKIAWVFGIFQIAGHFLLEENKSETSEKISFEKKSLNDLVTVGICFSFIDCFRGIGSVPPVNLVIVYHFFKHDLKLTNPEFLSKDMDEKGKEGWWIKIISMNYKGLENSKKILNLLEIYNQQQIAIQKNGLIYGLNYYQSLIITHVVELMEKDLAWQFNHDSSKDEDYDIGIRKEFFEHILDVVFSFWSLTYGQATDLSLFESYATCYSDDFFQEKVREIQEQFREHISKFQFLIRKNRLTLDPYYLSGIIDSTLALTVEVANKFTTLNQTPFKFLIGFIFPDYQINEPIIAEMLIVSYFKKGFPIPQLDLDTFPIKKKKIEFLDNQQFVAYLLSFIKNYYVSLNSNEFELIQFFFQERFFQKDFILNEEKFNQYCHKIYSKSEWEKKNQRLQWIDVDDSGVSISLMST